MITPGTELVEVPVAAHEAALKLLGKLVDAGEREGDRCVLCNKTHDDGAWTHANDCPIGHARLVRDALDYSKPRAQAKALKLLEQAGGAA